MLAPGAVILEISGNDKTLALYGPIEGKTVDINPDILDNPSLAGLAPYERGWILTIEPLDMLQALSNLLSGRSAGEWLMLESNKFRDLIKNETHTDLPLDRPIPKDFAAAVGEDTWKKIHETFFVQKKKKKKVKLYAVEDLH
jgi:Glycine cleavage H-protein